MTVLIKHSKVSTIPDTDDTSLVRPSDWNADHVVVGAAESGANTDITSLSGITGGISTPDFIQFDTTANETSAEGKLYWDDGEGVPAVGLKNGLVTLQIGAQEYARVFNDSGTTLTKGQAVYISGSQGNRIAVKLARADVEATSFGTIGLVAETMANGAEGYIIVSGALYKLNTLGLTAGATVYLSPSVAGGITTTKPQAPDQLVVLGWVERVDNNVGSIYVKVDNGYEIDELHDVKIVSPTTGQTLVYDQPTGVWNNSNAPTIIGGSINNTPIGATTPAAGTFTTITGQTEVLKGTGQNLLTRSQDLLNASWVSTATTVSATLYTDPLGGTTANNLIETAATNNHIIGINATVVAGLTYTFSVYLKKGIGATAPDWVQLSLSFAQFGTTYANFNLNTGVVGTTSGAVSSSITSVGNGWYRCSYTAICTTAGSSLFVVAFTNNSNGAGRLPSYAGATTSDMLVWGAQVELGSVVNTYIPTTTTAVYGTPSLSFSGVSTLGLESNGALYLQPAGTGAIQAQQATSTTAGGNVRGANAVDWQTNRTTAASRVASSTFSTLSGGSNNSSTGFASTVSGGESNQATNTYAFIGGGATNTASAHYSSIVGGYANSATGRYNFIGNGYANSGTANAAVTTQATTTVTSGSTAVTLSGSNANIRVGQLVTGTGINNFPDTYVAAISGTSLTLSQNATASGSPTLSFFTPHGVVVGGGNNQATGAYSFIGGGGDAGTSANRNVASGDWSVVAGGIRHTASGLGSFIGGGGVFTGTISGNTASAAISTVVGGVGNVASGFGSFIGGGATNTSNATYSSVLGGSRGITRGIVGNMAFSACSVPIANANGVTQSGLLVLGRETTNATPTVLASDANAAGTTNQVILPNNSAYYFRGEIVAGVTGGGNTKGWFIEGVIKRGANAASTAMVGTATVTSNYADAGAATWAVTATADTTNGGLAITVTGQASTTIRWVAQIRTTEMTF